MDIKQIMNERYTTKKYNRELSVSEDVIEDILDCAILAPSSINSQPWNFSIVSNSKLKEELAEVSFHNK